MDQFLLGGGWSDLYLFFRRSSKHIFDYFNMRLNMLTHAPPPLLDRRMRNGDLQSCRACSNISESLRNVMNNGLIAVV